ncbi:MAG TPA: proline dehydrogenase family protein [Longimicrobiales bacterium]|nr:proline dehydrogenase family protein [Longimicrobiales bacterium]
MLRKTLLWASKNPWMAKRLPRVRFVQRATRRFMPGEELEDALRAAEALAKDGLAATLTLLGESLESLEEADEVLEHYLELLREVNERGLDAEISVKPTQLGMDFGADQVRIRLERLAGATDSLVWVDMEASKHVDDTLAVFRAVKERHANVGLCLQAYLHRTEHDLEQLLPLEPALRLVKGAYREPESVAMARKADVDRSFVKLTSRVLRVRLTGGMSRPVIATHDPKMIGEANRLAYELGLAKDKYEFGMLYGISQAEQRRLARAGHPVRVLISYGPAWFPWYMRRLAERPANLWFVVRKLFG